MSFESAVPTRRTVDTTTGIGLPNHSVFTEPTSWFQIPHPSLTLFRCWRICDLQFEELELKTFIMLYFISLVHLPHGCIPIWFHVLHLCVSCMHAFHSCDDLVPSHFYFFTLIFVKFLRVWRISKHLPFTPPPRSKHVLSMSLYPCKALTLDTPQWYSNYIASE